MGRSPCCSKEGLNQGAWTALEDQKLSDYIKTHGEGKWRTIAKGTGLRRSGKSCRLRWLNYLRPDIKRGNITLEEEDLIIRLHKLLGNRWSLIAGRLPGRTDNEIKNYWNTVLGKKVKGEQSKLSNSNIVKKTETHLSAETRAGSTVVESMVIKPKASKCSKVLGAPQPLEAETPSTTVAPANSTDKNLLNDVLLASEEDDSGNFAMDFDLGELLMSDMSDSDFWRLYEFDYGIPERGKSRGSSDLWLSEEILDEWIGDGCFHYNTSLASVAEPQPH